MKLEAKSLHSEASGSVQTKNFTIKADSFMFDTLFSGMYKNPIQAAIREIWANAYDANKNIPFDVHMPTTLAPSFVVRDYGPGMSHDFVMNLYTQAGHSDKRDTNEVVGGFGLGSKAPLAYCDSFNVTSIHDGVKSIYNVYRQEDGLPVISCFDSSPTNERSGVEVSFAVNRKDVCEFHREARHLILGYLNLSSYPLFKRVEKEISYPKILFEKNGNVVIENGNWDYSEDTYIRMGCVCYPVRVLGTKRIPNMIFIVSENIGTYEITRSRDSLVLNTEIKQEILDKINSFFDDYIETYNEDLAKCSDVYEVYTKLLKEKFAYKNSYILNHLSYKNEFLTYHVEFEYAYSNRYQYRMNRNVRKDFFNVTRLPKTAVIINNSTKLVPSRVNAIRKHLNSEGFIYIEDESNVDSRIISFLKENTAVFYTEDFTPTRNSAKINQDLFDVFVGFRTHRKDYETFYGTYYYVTKTKNGRYVIGNVERTEKEAIAIVQKLSQHRQFKNAKFVGIPSTKMNRISKNKNITLISLNDYMRNEIQKNIQKISDYKSIVNSSSLHIQSLDRIFDALSKTNLKNKYLNAISRVNDVKNINSLLTAWTLYDTIDTSSDDLVSMIENLVQKAPLVRFAAQMSDEEMTHYLSLVGENNS